MPFTLYWMDHINYLMAGLLAIITEKQSTASGPLSSCLYVIAHLALVGSPGRCEASALKQGHSLQVIFRRHGAKLFFFFCIEIPS